MRTPTLLSSALAAMAGAGLLALPGFASATDVPLSSCSSWSITNNVFSCTPANTNAGAPSGCSATASVASLPSTGGQVSINASCSTVAATSWSWTGGFMQGSQGASGAGTIATTTTFTGTPSNGNGAGNPVSVTVSVASNTGGGQVPGGDVVCTGFSGTRLVKLEWSSVVAGGIINALTDRYGGFGSKDAVVVMFTTPDATSPELGSFTGAEDGGAAVRRTAVLSTKPCDFGPALASMAASAPTINFSVGPNAIGAAALQPNSTYYVNLKNEFRGAPTCSSASCGMVVGIKKPNGI